MTLRPKNADFLPCWRRRLSVLLRSNAVEVCWRLKRLGRAFFWHHREGETKTQTFASSFLFSFFHPAQAPLNSTEHVLGRDRCAAAPPRSLAHAVCGWPQQLGGNRSSKRVAVKAARAASLERSTNRGQRRLTKLSFLLST